ncbi:hypothetical protein F8S09_09580 [Deinococcus sp. SDU3-2]|uniref:Uncharacterized protein n=1 Tax=Deinococcus terrestris TaxID=2651870 RepID=A0A7X1TS02_9DEIO|nr:DUF6174 domain-containing protein [Deinococcus terrestris]MPY66939.1 hypothetical protein [Deinococcus terrestris]
MTLLRGGMLGVALGLGTVAGLAGAGGGGAPPPQAVCAPGYVRPDFAALRRELASARTRWALAGIRDYAYDFTEVAAPVLFPAVRVSVRQRQVQAVAVAAGQQGEPGPNAWGTVEDRFAAVASLLADGRSRPCPVVETDYDPQLGHPTRLYSGSGEANIADGWGEWRITNFTRVVPGGP